LATPGSKHSNLTLIGKQEPSKDQKSKLKPSGKLPGTKRKATSRRNDKNKKITILSWKPMKQSWKN